MAVRKALLNTTMLAGIVGAVHLVPSLAGAADITPVVAYKAAPPAWLPAVDGVNGKFDVLGGTLGHKDLYAGRASFSVPMGGQWGVQLDGTVGSLQHRGFGSLGGHFFWRDPSVGLLGFYAAHTRWNQFDGVHVTHLAGEGEYYVGRWTLQAIVGVEFGNSVSTTTTGVSIIPPFGPIPGVISTSTFTEGYDIKTRFMDQINLKYYFTDNWNGYVGHRYLGGKHALALGTEAAMPLGRGMMASAFLEGRAGEDQFQGVWGGLRFYFGQKDKTLIRRHREDDPIIWDTLHSIVNNYKTSGSSTSTQFCLFGPPIGGSCESFGPPS
jgi:hypothetical protein